MYVSPSKSSRPADPAKSCYMGAAKRYEHWNPQHLGYQFLAEAKRLWEHEVGKSRLTTIHAGLVITLVYNMSCMDRVGWTHTTGHRHRPLPAALRCYGESERSKRAMGTRFHRMGPVQLPMVRFFNPFCYRIAKGKSLHCYVMFDEPVIKNPPDIALPDPSTDPD